MIKKKIIFFLILILLNNCSFDSKTGIWSGGEDEKRKISEIEKEQNETLDVTKIYSSQENVLKEINLVENIVLSEPKNNTSWMMPGLNHQNYLGNIYLPSIDRVFLRKKIGKNKFTAHKTITSLIAVNNNIIFSDDKGSIFNIKENGKTKWKKNIYTKSYKRIYKSLTLSIYKNNIYIADNVGFIYALNLDTGRLVWIKNYGVPIRSKIKILNDKIYLIDQDNRIICLSSKDGSALWDILSISSFIKTQDLLSVALTEAGDLISINSAGDLFKVNGNRGNIIWSRSTSMSPYATDTDFFRSSDIVVTNNEIIFSAEASIYSYNIDNGETNWETKINTISSPIIDGKNIFFITENGFFVILDKDSGTIISSTNILKILKKRKRETKITGFIMGSGKIYSLTLNGYLIVSSASSGKVEYSKKIGDQLKTSPIINNGKLYILTENSKIIGFR